MRPILLIHGYSAESEGTSASEITKIYGTLPRDLRRKYGNGNVFELNVGRYLSLEDGIKLDDLARALDRALRVDYPTLLENGFDIIIHSTGALVARAWLRNHSSKPSPIGRLIYLAGANFGSGWAHIGKGRFAKWKGMVFDGGAERGLQILDALELGSSETIDLHRHFMRPENRLHSKYKVREFCVIGSQWDGSWLRIPIRYSHEDGSDGVVRVAGCNVAFNYVHILPKNRALELEWDEIREASEHLGKSPDLRTSEPEEYYRVDSQYLADESSDPPVPLAIPFECAHSGDDMGIVRGKGVRKEVLELIDLALKVKTDNQYRRAATEFADRTQKNYAAAVHKLKPGFIEGLFNEPREQYDPHAQVIFRIRDQYGMPVKHFDVFFHSTHPDQSEESNVNTLFEDSHGNSKTDGIICFYLRVQKFNKTEGDWEDKLARVGGVHLEVTSTEPGTEEIKYLPMCLTISNERLRRFIQSHRTTVIDVQLLRLPSPKVFMIKTAKV